MDLVTLREKFVKLSGRYDLVVNTIAWADNGADFFINAGQKYLEKYVETPENTAQIYLPLAIGEYSLSFQHHCRSIESVFVNNNEERFELEKVKLSELKDVYNELASEETTGEPVYYALANLRALETTAQASLGTFINITHDEDDTKYDYRGLIIVPPVDEAYVVEVTGVFMQNILTANTDENWWSEEYPHVLIMGAMRMLEVFNRNSEGVKDWDRAIMSELIEIDKDQVHEVSINIDQMMG